MISCEVAFFMLFAAVEAEMLVATKEGRVGEAWDSACKIKYATFASHDRVQYQC
jgi:hypothetical protein